MSVIQAIKLEPDVLTMYERFNNDEYKSRIGTITLTGKEDVAVYDLYRDPYEPRAWEVRRENEWNERVSAWSEKSDIIYRFESLLHNFLKHEVPARNEEDGISVTGRTTYDYGFVSCLNTISNL